MAKFELTKSIEAVKLNPRTLPIREARFRMNHPDALRPFVPVIVVLVFNDWFHGAPVSRCARSQVVSRPSVTHDMRLK